MRPPLRRPVLQTGRCPKGLPNRQSSRNREGLFAEKEGAGAAPFSIPPQQPDEAALDLDPVGPEDAGFVGFVCGFEGDRGAAAA